MAKKRAELNPADYQGKESPEYWKNLIPCTGRPLSSAIHRQKDPQSIPMVSPNKCVHYYEFNKFKTILA